MFKLNITIFFKSILLLFVIIGFGGVFPIFYLWQYEFLFLFFSIVVVVFNNGMLNLKMFFLFLSICFLLIVHSLITQTSLSNYLFILITILQTVLVIAAFRNDCLDIKKHLSYALKIILVLSLLNIILLNIPFSIYSDFVNVNTGYTVNSIFTVFNKMATKEIFGIEWQRNQGLFWEPGILQIPMNILLYYELIEKNGSFNKTVVLTILVILSTLSTTGFIVLLLILIYKFRKLFSFNNVSNGKKIFLIFLIVLFIPLLVTEIMDKTTGVNRASFLLRTYDLFIGLKLFSHYPLFGIGYDMELYNKLTGGLSVIVSGDDMSVERGNTNSFILILVYFGVFTFFTSLIFLYKQSVFYEKKIFFVILFISLCSEPLFITSFVFLFIFSSFTFNTEFTWRIYLPKKRLVNKNWF